MQKRLFTKFWRSTFALLAFTFNLGVITEQAFASTPPKLPDANTFISTANLHWNQLKRSPQPAKGPLPIGIAAYISLTELIRGQSQISVENIDAKLLEKLALQDLSWDQGAWKLARDSGKSIVPTTDPISVVKGPQGYVVIDGHHDLYLSLFVGASSIAVRVEEDLSNLSPLDFWSRLKKRSLVLLPESAAELAKRPPDMTVIKNNPNRYLAALLALKVQADLSQGQITIQKVKGTSSAVWVKLNNSIPFIEFYLAELMSQAGVEYDARWGTQVPSEVVAKVRTALLHPQNEAHTRKIEKLLIIDEAKSKLGMSQDQAFLLKELQKHYQPRFGSQCGAVFQF